MICFDDENLVSQELLCACKGYIHTECLKFWIESSNNMNPNTCSVCKTQFDNIEIKMIKKVQYNHKNICAILVLLIASFQMTFIILVLIVSAYQQSFNHYTLSYPLTWVLISFFVSSILSLFISSRTVFKILYIGLPLYTIHNTSTATIKIT